MAKKPDHSWWVPSVIITMNWFAFWGVERVVWPSNTGFTGAVVGTLIGFIINVTLESYYTRLNLK